MLSGRPFRRFLPSFGSTLWVSPAELRLTVNTIQRFVTGGQSLQDVAASLRQGAVQHSELPMIGILRHEMKWHSRNTGNLWCFKEAMWNLWMSSHLLTTNTLSARSEDKDQWYACDYLSTSAVQSATESVVNGTTFPPGRYFLAALGPVFLKGSTSMRRSGGRGTIGVPA